MTSTASCTLTGHMVIVDGWASPSDTRISAALTPGAHIYYAYGQTWSAFLADQGATAVDTTLQLQLTNDAAALLQQAQNGTGNPSFPAATQQQVAEVIAKALGGTTDRENLTDERQ